MQSETKQIYWAFSRLLKWAQKIFVNCEELTPTPLRGINSVYSSKLSMLMKSLTWFWAILSLEFK